MSHHLHPVLEDCCGSTWEFCDSLDMKYDTAGLMSLLLLRVLFLEAGQMKWLLED